MTRSRTPQVAFSSGELSPLLYYRQDYQRFQTGLRACVGFIPLRQGGVTRAPGTLHRGSTKDNKAGRLSDFEFAENDALVLELTDGIMRVWRYGALVESGGAPYELAIPYDLAAIQRLNWVQSADVIYLADGVLPIQKLSRFALDNWTIADLVISDGPFRAANIEKAQTMTASAATGSVTITGTGDIFSANWVGSLIRLEPVSYEAIPLWTGNTTVAVGDKMRNAGHIYEVAAGTDTGVNAPVHTEGTEITGKSTGIQWTHISDGVGVVRVTGFTNTNEVTADVIKDLPPPVVSDGTYRWAEGAWSDRRGYPAAVEIYTQRLAGAFTPDEPRTVWFSTAGLFDGFEPSGDADGSFAYAIAGSNSQNGGQWLKASRRGIYIGALGEVYRGFSDTKGQTIGPTTFDTSIEATDGANGSRPIAPYGYPILITKEGGRVQELRYKFEEDGAVPLELSLPSQHLGSKGFKEIAWQSAPQRIAWVMRGSGDLALMLYDPNEDVLGWAPYPLAGGHVESMAITTDDVTGYDTLTMIVRREIDGATVRFVEEQAVIWGIIAGEQPLHEAVHLFSSQVFDLADDATTFSVPHLAGEEVYVWTNAGEYGPITVAADGTVEIEWPVTHAVIGLLDETHYFETLNTVARAPDGDSAGRPKRLNAGAGVMVHRTGAGRVSCVERDVGQPERVSPPVDLIPLKVAEDLVTAYSGTIKNPAVSGHAGETSYRFKPFGGAPMTILGLTSQPETEAA